MAHLLIYYADPDMNKALLQLFIFLALFFSCWLLLGRIDFIQIFKIGKYANSTEEKLGDLIYESISKTETENFDSLNLAKLNAIKMDICSANNLDTAGIKLHLIKNPDINAFALPNGHLMVYTGLISDCENAEELSGAIGHEIAHIEHHHVMKKLIKEIGLSALIFSSSGNGGGEVLRRAVKLLSSTAYDRRLETDADKTSVDYLCKAHIDPEPFANLLYRLGNENGADAVKGLDWISTHPEAEKRSKEVLDYIKSKKVQKRPLMPDADWAAFKNSVGKI
jgi:predicted Zn-dependent protease